MGFGVKVKSEVQMILQSTREKPLALIHHVTYPPLYRGRLLDELPVVRLEFPQDVAGFHKRLVGWDVAEPHVGGELLGRALAHPPPTRS